MGSISSQYYQAVQVQLVISMLHRFDLIDSIRSRYAHQFKRLSGSSKNCSALGKDSGEIFGCEHTVFTIDQSFISIIKSINFKVIYCV